MNHYRNENGFVSVTALWIVLILMLFASGIVYKVRLDVKINGQRLQWLKAKHIARSGIRKAHELLNADTIRYVDWIGESWYENESIFKGIELGSGYIDVSHHFINEDGDTTVIYGIVDEQSKLNVNVIPKQILERLPDVSSDLAAAIIDWRDEDDIPLTGGAENVYYLSLSKPYKCKNADFEILEELILVRGMTADILRGILPYVTVYGNGKININTTNKQVMACIGFDRDLIEKILLFRKDGVAEGDFGEYRRFFRQVSDIRSDLHGLTPAQINTFESVKEYLDVRSEYFRIESTGSISNSAVSSNILEIVSRSDSGYVQVEYWHES